MAEWTAEKVIDIINLIRTLNVDSLDRKVKGQDGSEYEIGETIMDTKPSPQEIVEANDMHRMLMEAISMLPPRQQIIIKLRFGMEDGIRMTLEEVGNMYGVTRERIRQVEVRALERLKWILITKYKIKGVLYETK